MNEILRSFLFNLGNHLLKPEGDAKIQAIMSQAESSKAPVVPKTLTDIKNQWDNTLHLANTYLR